MANRSKLHRPGRGRPHTETFRDMPVQIYDEERKRVFHTTAVCKGYEPRDMFPEMRERTYWEFRGLHGELIVLRRSSLPRNPEPRD